MCMAPSWWETNQKGTECIKAGLIIIDIDNQADGKDSQGNKIQQQELSEAQALELQIVKQYCSFAYQSPSYKRIGHGWD